MDLLEELKCSLSDRYRIERQIGAGGMATVYLARDLRHDRPVALKVLKPHLGAAVGPERFLSEIRVTANLQHPNLLPLFDSGEAAGQLYYVMPYVAGETLGARLERERQLPVEEAIRIAVAVASALDYAHRRGVIHRDLKPDNILLEEGQVLIADFGIALALSHAGGERLTQTGLAIGSPQYMSPEQAAGDLVSDARTDVYALGAVLYEMLTGEPPHVGSTTQATIARVMTEKPRSVRGQRPSVPKHVEAAVLRALEKLPADRFASARQFADALIIHGPFDAGAARRRSSDGGVPVRRVAPLRITTTIAVVATLSAVTLAVVQLQRRPDPEPGASMRFTIPLAGGETLNLDDLVTATISEDGQTIVYVAGRAEKRRLVVRSLGDIESRPLAGTEGARAPFFSPDGRSVGFFAGRRLLRIPVNGGEPTVITEVIRPERAVWLRDNRILIPTTAFVGRRSGLSVVPAGGGAARPLTRADSTKGENHFGPLVLPDGETLIFNSNGPGGDEDNYLAIGSMATGDYTRLDVTAGRAVGLVGDLLIYLRRGGSLMAVPVDVGARRVRGDPILLMTGVADEWKATLSQNGSLLYVQGGASTALVLADERGGVRQLLTGHRGYGDPRFSPDGQRIAFTIAAESGDEVWVYDAGSATSTRIAPSPADRPEWTPDGRRVVFRVQAGEARFHWTPIDGSEGISPLPIRAPPGDQQQVVFSPDGRFALFRITSRQQGDLYYAPLDGADSARAFVSGVADEFSPRFAPDGRWVAYVSDESATRQVYVRAFPGAGPRVQISTRSGDDPMWSPDGRTLYYWDGNEVIAATVARSPTFRVLSRTSRLKWDFTFAEEKHANYDVTRDGKELLLPQSRDSESSLVWVGNWVTELRSRIAAERR